MQPMKIHIFFAFPKATGKYSTALRSDSNRHIIQLAVVGRANRRLACAVERHSTSGRELSINIKSGSCGRAIDAGCSTRSTDALDMFV
jgi:hypothetical protein